MNKIRNRHAAPVKEIARPGGTDIRGFSHRSILAVGRYRAAAVLGGGYALREAIAGFRRQAVGAELST